MAFGRVARGAPKDRSLNSSLSLVLLLSRNPQSRFHAVSLEQYNQQTALGSHAACLWMGLACLLGVRCLASTYGDVLMSVISIYKTTCRCCDFIETALMTSFTAIANFFALARIAQQAANTASTGDYKKAKAMILKI